MDGYDGELWTLAFGCGGGVLTSHMNTASLLVTTKHITAGNESSQCLKFHNHGEASTTSSSWFKVPNCFRHYALTQRSRDNLFYTNCLSLRTLLVLVTQFSDGSFLSLKHMNQQQSDTLFCSQHHSLQLSWYVVYSLY